MITATEDFLERPEEERVKAWLLDPACDLFIDSLAAEAARLEVEAMAYLARNPSALMHEGIIPLSATRSLRSAAELSTVIRIIKAKTVPDAPLYRTRLTIVPDA